MFSPEWVGVDEEAAELLYVLTVTARLLTVMTRILKRKGHKDRDRYQLEEP